MSIIAFVTTDSNTLGADPGVTISDYEGDVHADMAHEVAPLGEDEYGDLDEDAADELLARLGYSRVIPWTRSGGQWGAEVEKIA